MELEGLFLMMKLDAGLKTSDPGSTGAWGNKRINPRSAPVLFVSELEWMPFQTTVMMVTTGISTNYYLTILNSKNKKKIKK